MRGNDICVSIVLHWALVYCEVFSLIYFPNRSLNKDGHSMRMRYLHLENGYTFLSAQNANPDAARTYPQLLIYDQQRHIMHLHEAVSSYDQFKIVCHYFQPTKSLSTFILTNEPIQEEHYSKTTSCLPPAKRGYSSIWHQLYITLQLITKNDQQCSCPQKAPFSPICPSSSPPPAPLPVHSVSSSCILPCLSSQIEIQDQSYNLKQSFQRMDCLARQGNYLDLKFQDNGDYYLINSFLGLGKNDDDAFIDDLIQDAPQGEMPKEGAAGEDFAGQVVREGAEYLCFRTTSLREIMDYLNQYYRIPPQKHKEVLAAARKLKLKLKRSHARLRTPITDQRPPVDQPVGTPVELKVEQSQVSPFVFSEESQQTRKKKRNRMSAQNSRDRKKEYIRQIQGQNRELKRRLAHAQRSRRTQPDSRDFLKMILCLGITCYANLDKTTQQIQPSLVLPVEDKIVPQQIAPSAIQGKTLTLAEQGLPLEMQLLNPWQQGAILELIETMGENMPEGRRMIEAGLQCTDLISEAASERSTSSEGCRKSHQTHYL